jgi:hypothetical protein
VSKLAKTALWITAGAGLLYWLTRKGGAMAGVVEASPPGGGAVAEVSVPEWMTTTWLTPEEAAASPNYYARAAEEAFRHDYANMGDQYFTFHFVSPNPALWVPTGRIPRLVGQQGPWTAMIPGPMREMIGPFYVELAPKGKGGKKKVKKVKRRLGEGLGMPPPPPPPPDTCQRKTAEGDAVDDQHSPTIAASYLPGYTSGTVSPASSQQVDNPAYARCVAAGGKIKNNIDGTPQFCLRPERAAYMQCKRAACVAATQYGCHWYSMADASDKSSGIEYGGCTCPANTPWTPGVQSGSGSPITPELPMPRPPLTAHDRSTLRQGVYQGWIGQDRMGRWYEKKYPPTCIDTGYCQQSWYRTNDPLAVVLAKLDARNRSRKDRQQGAACEAAGGHWAYDVAAQKSTCLRAAV